MATLLEVLSEKASLAPLQIPANARPRILLVDDDTYIRELNAGVLLQAGYQVDTAADGADAWQALQDVSYDLLITDNTMPRITGLELIKLLRSQEMTLPVIPLPVILVSGAMSTEELKQHPWLQLDASLHKPFTIATFLATVKKVLQAAESASSSSQLFRDCAVLDNETSPAEKPANPPYKYQAYLSQRILVVDDDNDTRQLSVDVLVGSGYDVDGVTDGAEGWEALQTLDYDLIVTDNKMPRMTGLEMIEKLREARMRIPVIMATGNPPTLEFKRRPWLKPELTLQRPFSTDDLLVAVKTVLGTDDGYAGGNETLLPKYL